MDLSNYTNFEFAAARFKVRAVSWPMYIHAYIPMMRLLCKIIHSERSKGYLLMICQAMPFLRFNVLFKIPNVGRIYCHKGRNRFSSNQQFRLLYPFLLRTTVPFPKYSLDRRYVHEAETFDERLPTTKIYRYYFSLVTLILDC